MLTWVSEEGRGCSRKGSGCDVTPLTCMLLHLLLAFGIVVEIFFKNLNLILVMGIIVAPAHQAWGCSAVLLRNGPAL